MIRKLPGWYSDGWRCDWVKVTGNDKTSIFRFDGVKIDQDPAIRLSGT